MIRSTRRTLLLSALFVALAVLAACGDDETPGAGSTTSPPSSPSPTPTSTTVEETEWTITVPAGWTREDVTSQADAKKAIKYAGADGSFVIVAFDPDGSDFNPDVVWRYEVRGNAFEIAEKTPCAPAHPDLPCPTNDSRFDGWAIWRIGGDAPIVGGHRWYFIFGNTAHATVDQSLFEQIIEGIRVKGA